jgi:hypothetical protein
MPSVSCNYSPLSSLLKDASNSHRDDCYTYDRHQVSVLSPYHGRGLVTTLQEKGIEVSIILVSSEQLSNR